MLAELNTNWKWQLIKTIVKHSIQNNKNRYVISQEMIELVKSNPKMVKELFKKANRAENHLKIASKQFNEVVEEQAIKNSIYKMIKCEKEMIEVINSADQFFEQLFSS